MLAFYRFSSNLLIIFLNMSISVKSSFYILCISFYFSAIRDAGPELLSIKKLDLKIQENAVAHHTDEYDITDKLQNPNKEEFLVVRRGQSFDILLECNRPYKQCHDDLRILLTFGK